MPPRPTATAGHFAFQLDGVSCGFLKSVEGGNIKGVVAREPGPDGEKKHIQSSFIEDFTIRVGFSMAQEFYDWVFESFTQKRTARSGSIVTLDFNLKVVSEQTFENAIVTALTFPASDGGSKAPAFLTITFSVGATRTIKASGAAPAPSVKEKSWLASNFRLKIDGLDCTRVTKVDGFTISNPRSEPAAVTVPDLRIALAASSGDTWAAWHQEFVVDGLIAEEKEKGGVLECLSSDMRTTLFSVTFSNLGIFGLALEKGEANIDAVGRLVADLYCERMVFSRPK